MGASCAVPEGAFSSPLLTEKPRGEKKGKTSGERRAETFPLLLRRAGQQGSLRLPFPSVRWEVTIDYVPFPCSASPGLQHPLPGLRGVSQPPALGDAGQGELRSQNRAQAVSASAPSDPRVQLQRETHGTFRPFSPDGWHGASPRLCSQLPNKLPGGSANSQELLPLPVNAGDGREGTSRTCISCIPRSPLLIHSQIHIPRSASLHPTLSSFLPTLQAGPAQDQAQVPPAVEARLIPKAVLGWTQPGLGEAPSRERLWARTELSQLSQAGTDGVCAWKSEGMPEGCVSKGLNKQQGLPKIFISCYVCMWLWLSGRGAVIEVGESI